MHIILGEISREFSLTFLTIDWGSGLKHNVYDEKYRSMCRKLEEAEMLTDIYFPELVSVLNELDGAMDYYWGYFRQVLYLEEKGEKVDHNTGCYKDAFKFSKQIPGLVSRAHGMLRDLAMEVTFRKEPS